MSNPHDNRKCCERVVSSDRRLRVNCQAGKETTLRSSILIKLPSLRTTMCLHEVIKRMYGTLLYRRATRVRCATLVPDVDNPYDLA